MEGIREVEAAVEVLAKALASTPALEEDVRARWRVDGRGREGLDAELASAADTIATALPELGSSEEGLEALRPAFTGSGAPVLLSWCSASAWRPEIGVAPLLRLAADVPSLAARVAAAAADRVVAGPLRDALRCAPFIGDGTRLHEPDNVQARARLEILLWEAGASTEEIAELGPWVWGTASTFEALVAQPALGSLRGRVLAARCIEVSASSLPADTEPALVRATLAVLQPLLLHPEPLVWVHAARALGRLMGPLEQLHGMLLDWVTGDAVVLRQRALTALASLPAERVGMLGSQLRAVVVAPTEDPWVLAAVAAATPYLFYERRDIWQKLADRILAGDGGSTSARALAWGLAALWRRGTHDVEIAEPLRALRNLARTPPTSDLEELRRWIQVVAITDILDGAERDPLDLERGLDNLVRIAAQYDDEEADARAARFAAQLAPTLAETRRIAVGPARPRHRAAAMNALLANTRVYALALWAPLLVTHPTGQRIEEPDLDEAWKRILEAPGEILELVGERRREAAGDPQADEALEALALRLGGHALDAGSDTTDVTRRGHGSTAHAACRWLRKVDGLFDGSRTFSPEFEHALSQLFWRLVDGTRGTARRVDDDDAKWLGPFAAWWALVIDRPAVLRRVAKSLPLLVTSALEFCCEQAELLHTAVSSGGRASRWSVEAASALEALQAGGTELAHALGGLGRALENFAQAVGRAPGIEPLCVELVLAADRLVRALADPVKALQPAPDEGMPDSLAETAAPNAPRVAGLVARAIANRDPSLVEVWLASLGPVTSALVDEAIRQAIQRTPPLPPKRTEQPSTIHGYELVRPLGEGGVGSVWLVRKPGADRLFVLKIPKGEVLEAASDVERRGILDSFIEEAAALADLYHPNLANIVDRGVSKDIPFLVLDYLIGADLKQYADARPMTLFELRKPVLETCAGLAALHSAGLVHRDIKPGNIFLRLPLSRARGFDPQAHRDPAVAPPLSTVIIDFGMVRAAKVSPEVGGRFVAGTVGFIAPEQVLDPVELDPRADVYALAATIYRVTTGRAFFDDIDEYRDRIVAHMQSDPLADEERLRTFPAAIANLLRAATAHDPVDRPQPLEFAAAFAEAL